MNIYDFYRGPVDSNVVYRAWYDAPRQPTIEVTFRQETTPDGKRVSVEATARRLIPGGRLTGTERVRD